ncbi:MAG: Nif3-like dinuclear metal center hexameric protein [Armatimonadetes bacterium]|nr:Nif3-like dinuclear metal center hexameric protein [Armatimonadota bacterium]
MTTVGEVSSALARWAPPRLAESWDNVGLLLGDPGQPVRHVLTTLDLTDAVLDEAAALAAEMVVAFHPPIFSPLARVVADEPASRLIWRAASERRSLYATHTALDNVSPGTSDFLAEALGLTVRGPLVPRPAAGALKVVTFVPTASTDAVAAAMASAGAGRIGDYAECSFRVAGTGAFRGLDGARPAVGTAGRLERVAEDRLEMVVSRADLAAVTAALRVAHPYEEVAYDVYATEPAEPASIGMGRVAELAEPVTLSELAERVTRVTQAAHPRVVGDWRRPVRRVAIVGGSGASFVAHAAQAGADVLVTGDVKHHDALLAARLGLALVDPGHFASERLVIGRTAAFLSSEFPDLMVTETSVDGEPFARRPGG